MKPILRYLPIDIQIIVWEFYGYAERKNLKIVIRNFYGDALCRLKYKFGYTEFVNELYEWYWRSRNLNCYFIINYINRRCRCLFFKKFYIVMERQQWLGTTNITKIYPTLRGYQKKQVHKNPFHLKMVVNAEFTMKTNPNLSFDADSAKLMFNI